MAVISHGGARTRTSSDPLRNFKYQVDVYHHNNQLTSLIAQMGFTGVSGLSMSTEMTAYREGGWNTNPHKLPGLTDFPPLTLSAGVFSTKPGMWDLAMQMFAFQWGEGTLGMDEDFRFSLAIKVLDHPVTKGAASGVGGSSAGAVLGWRAFNAWVGNVSFGDLNAMDNQVLISSVTMHHEGLQTYFGASEVASWTHRVPGS